MRRTLALILLLTASLAARGQDDAPRGLRVIFAESEAEAAALRTRIVEGFPFELLARDSSIDPSGEIGGVLGQLTLEDVRPEFRAALSGLEPGAVSSVVEIGDSYALLQWLTDAEEEWRDAMARAFRAMQLERYAESRRGYAHAVELARAFGAGDYRLAQSLTDLAAIARLGGRYSEGEALLREALEIQERIRGPEHTEVAQALTRLGEMLLLSRVEARLPEAESAFRRSLAILETAVGPSAAATAAAQTQLGLVLQAQGRHPEARPLLERSLQITEQIRGPEHPDVAQALDDLVSLHLLEGDLTSAGPLATRAVEIAERTLPAGHPLLISALEQRVEVYQGQGRYADAISDAERILSLRWGGPSRTGNRVRELLDAFTGVLHRSAFGEEQSQVAMERYRALLAGGRFAEDLYPAMAEILVASELPDIATEALSEGIRKYPDSLRLQSDLAETYAGASKTETALAVFREAGRLAEVAGASAREKGFFFRRIGDMLTRLSRYEEAADAIGQAIEINPDDVQAWISKSQIDYLTNAHERALEGYARAAGADPENVAVLVRMAEIAGLLGRYDEAAAAARLALALDPDDSRPHYLLGTALVREGESEEGRLELEAYESLRAAEEAAEQRTRSLAAALDEASLRLGAGRLEEALSFLENAVDTFPEADILSMVLGLLQAQIGNHEDAVVTLGARIRAQPDAYFLLHAALAQAYEAAGDPAGSRRYRLSYLRQIDKALLGALDG